MRILFSATAIAALAVAGLQIALAETKTEADREALARAVCVGESPASADIPQEVADTLTAGSPTCVALETDGELPEAIRTWLDGPKRVGLSLDALMADATPSVAEERRPEPLFSETPEPAAVGLSSPDRASGNALGQLDLDGIEAGREAVKTEQTLDRVRLLAETMTATCLCVDEPPCFAYPQFSHEEMNAALEDEAAEYQQQVEGMCRDWRTFADGGLPEDRQSLEQVAEQLNVYLDTEQEMQRTIHARAGEFRAEERRIARAQAEARARAQAQQKKKKSGFLAAMVTLGAGAALGDSLGMEIAPEALARTSISVGNAVRNGEGMAGAIGAGVSGFDQMARTATPKVTTPPADTGSLTADAMQHVKRFPAPGAATSSSPGAAASATAFQGSTGATALQGGPASGMFQGQGQGGSGTAAFPGQGHAASASPSGLGSAPSSASWAQGLSAESVTEAERYLQAGIARADSSTVTPGNGTRDEFGVPDPIRETVSYTCRKKSSFPLADGNGGVKYYYEHEVNVEIRYWIPECGEAKKANYIARGCNNIDDFAAVEARCVQACGAPDCRSTKFESQILSGAVGGGGTP